MPNSCNYKEISYNKTIELTIISWELKDYDIIIQILHITFSFLFSSTGKIIIEVLIPYLIKGTKNICSLETVPLIIDIFFNINHILEGVVA